MTIDYTKISEQKTSAPKAEAIHNTGASSTTTKPHELEERICTRCYWRGLPRIAESGSWLGLIIPFFFETPQTLYGCRECNHPNSMVTLTSREGEHAMHWHLKKAGKSNKDGAQF